MNQYKEPWRSLYAHIDTCPEELLLFFHYVPYTYVLKTGKTLIQHIYDTHFECVAERLERQLQNAKEWRDRINTYFYRKCGIGDEKGRTIY